MHNHPHPLPFQVSNFKSDSRTDSAQQKHRGIERESRAREIENSVYIWKLTKGQWVIATLLRERERET
jgi:hypothetical protein